MSDEDEEEEEEEEEEEADADADAEEENQNDEEEALLQEATTEKNCKNRRDQNLLLYSYVKYTSKIFHKK